MADLPRSIGILGMTSHGRDPNESGLPARATSRAELLVFRRWNLHDDAAGGVVGHVSNGPSPQRFAQGVGMGFVMSYHQQVHTLFLGHTHNCLTHFPRA
jgi:hypothetical protein